MIIDVISLKDPQTSFDFSIASEEIDLQGEAIRLKSALKIEGNVKKGIAQTDVRGKIFAEIEVECSRCLLPVETAQNFPFEAIFVAPENYTQVKEAELAADDLEVSIFEDDKINLTELAREQILLNLPTQIFCREDCRGLCQKCGANRNLIDCSCKENDIDPRWSALRNFK